jgi:pantoate--beta-alanine ligase
VRRSGRPVPATGLKRLVRRIVSQARAARLDYVEFFDPETLLRTAKVGRGTQMALAVLVGKTRLIDNGRL